MSFTYTTGVPGANNNPSTDQTTMLTNTNSISGILAIDHIGFNASNGGYHNVIHFSNQSGDPETVSGVGQAYTKTANSDQQLFFKSGGGVITQLTGPNNPSASSNGYTWLPGGILLQWGKVTGMSSGANAVTFASANIEFPENCFTVNLQPIRIATSNVDTLYILTGSVSKTGFTITNTSSSIPTCYWVAIGN